MESESEMKLLSSSIKNSAAAFHQKFSNAGPFKYLIIDGFLDNDFAEAIEKGFPALDSMKTKYKGLNENKAEDSSFEKFSEPIRRLNSFIHSPEFIDWISDVSGISDISTIQDRLGSGLHQGGNGSFLDIHIDYNIHPVKKKHRRLNLILFFNREWKEEWGGLLELWNKEKCFEKILPAFNRMVLFECNEISYHGYSTIHCPENVTRKSYYHYFFSWVPKGLTYHDTVFLIKPEDSFSKKLMTKTKEILKNKIKLIFFKTGFHRFLK